MVNRIESYFEFDRLGTNWRTEILAGFTTFISMAYIVLVNPSILAEVGMPLATVTTATCLSAAIASILGFLDTEHGSRHCRLLHCPAVNIYVQKTIFAGNVGEGYVSNYGTTAPSPAAPVPLPPPPAGPSSFLPLSRSRRARATRCFSPTTARSPRFTT